MKIWVVEMYNEYSGKYEATIGVGLVKSDGLLKLKDWKKNNPSDKFRLTKYQRVERS